MKYKLLVLVVLVSLTTGVSAAEVEVTTQQDWNQGDYSGTSAERNDNSGDLGLGYRNGTSSDSLIGYWRLDRSISGSGGTVLDYSGNGNDGAARNGVNTGVQGVFSTDAMKFDGESSVVEIRDSESLSITGEITISAWMKSVGKRTVTIESTTDNIEDVYLDGKLLWTDEAWQNRHTGTFELDPGRHVLAYKAKNNGGPASLVASVKDSSGNILFRTKDDGTWNYVNGTPESGWQQKGFNDSNWGSLVKTGDMGDQPWDYISGWEDSDADWIWWYPNADDTGSEETIYVRKEFTLGGEISKKGSYGITSNSGFINHNFTGTMSTDSSGWNLVTLTYDGSIQRLYKNGGLVAEKQLDETIKTNSKSLTIGREGTIDEVRIYNRSLSNSEIRKLYLEGKPFHGNYTRKVHRSEEEIWGKIEINSNIPTNTEASAVFKSLDGNENILGREKVGLQDGFNNYSIDIPISKDFEIVLEGNSSDPTDTWKVANFSVYTSEFCDYRGPKNECVMNSTRQLEAQTYDVDSIFKSRSTAVFEAFSGISILNISNSSRLSGTWKGGFDIRSTPVTIEPGASFKPENGRIIVGE
jgi:hypothetical protein